MFCDPLAAPPTLWTGVGTGSRLELTGTRDEIMTPERQPITHKVMDVVEFVIVEPQD
jgi:hypothetical protein